MKLRTILIPTTAIVAGAAYVAFHPGLAYAEPRMAKAPLTPLAKEASYNIDPMHTSIYFEITHMGLSQVHGRINKFSGKIKEDASDLTKSSVEFTAQMDTIDTGVAPRDEHLKTADFFDVKKFPELSFKSTKITKKGAGFVVVGDLTIKGKTKSVSIPFKHHGPVTITVGEPFTQIGVVAEPIVIKRSDFGIGTQFKLPDGTEGVSDDVKVTISLEATLVK